MLGFITIRRILIVLVILTWSESVVGEEKKPLFYLEEVQVSEKIRFYNQLNKESNLTAMARSNYLNSTKIGYFLRENLLEKPLFNSNSELSGKKALFVKLSFDHLSLVKSNQKEQKLDEAIFTGSIVLTNRYGDILDDKSAITVQLNSHEVLSKSSFSNEDEAILKLTLSFVDYMIESLSNRIDSYFNDMDYNEDWFEGETTPIEIKNATRLTPDSIRTSERQKNPEILKILSERRQYTGTVISRDGLFICDYNAIDVPNLLKVITASNDTLTATLKRLDKSWGMAICQVNHTFDTLPNYDFDPTIQVGETVSFKGFSGISYLPLIKGSGAVTGKINFDNQAIYLFDATNAESMSGAPVLNEEGEIYGVLISANYGGLAGGKSYFTCVPLNVVRDLFSFKFTG